MEQREATPNGPAEPSIGTIRAARVADDRPGLANANADTFCEALQEARLARYGGEIKRAHYFYQQALQAAPQNIDSETLAEILENLQDTERILAQEEKSLPALRAAVEQDPANSERRFSYANLLWKLGREEEAGALATDEIEFLHSLRIFESHGRYRHEAGVRSKFGDPNDDEIRQVTLTGANQIGQYLSITSLTAVVNAIL
jgi:tetratricopeptide (TPR) repeat protein